MTTNKQGGTVVGPDARHPRYRVAIVTSVHPDFDARLWKYAKLVRDLGHETHMVCPWRIEDGSSYEGIHFHTFQPVPSRLQRLWRIPCRVLSKLLPILRDVDLVHFHDLDILPLMTVLRPLKPIVYDVHENYSVDVLERPDLPAPLRWILFVAISVVQWICSHIIRHVVLVSRHQEERSFGSKWLHKTCIRNFASVELLRDVNPDYRLRPDAVVYTASQSVTNGSLLLLEIAQAVHRSAPQVVFYAPDRFWIPAFRERFLAERARLGLEDVVILVPNVKPHLLVKETLNRATIALSPNLRVTQQVKGAHNKIFEYMAAALPIVCSDLPDQVEEVAGNDCGIVAQPEDPNTFVEAILRLVGDRAYAERLGGNGQRVFRERYTWEAQGPKLQLFYEEILEGKTRRHSP
jgi:glycosyltransferase involved in cell wall biosynthesis